MPTRHILDVEINDGAWLKFQAQFKQYQDALAQQPKSWDEATKAIDGTRKSFDDLVAASSVRLQRARLIAEAEKVASEQLKRQVDAEKWVTEQTTRQARSWADMAKNTKTFAANIGHATTSLLRWGSITGIISGVLGAGGLFGIERLAASAGNQRRSSLGLGVTPGEQSSFQTNLGRIIDPDAVLGGVNDALHDPRKAAAFGGLGLDYNTERTRGTYEASIDAIRALKRLADQTPAANLGPTFDARRLGDLGFTLQDFQRAKATPLAELEDYLKHAATDKGTLNLTGPQSKAWQDLQVQLGRASREIEKTFVVGLTGLAEPIGHLSKSFVDLVGTAFGTGEFKKWVDEAADGIDTFATYIGTPKFKADVESFAANVGLMAEKIVAGMRFLGLIPEATATGGSDDIGRTQGGLSSLPIGSPLWNNVPDSEQGNYVNSPRSQRFLRGDYSDPNAPNGIPRTGPLFGPQLPPSGFGKFGAFGDTDPNDSLRVLPYHAPAATPSPSTLHWGVPWLDKKSPFYSRASFRPGDPSLPRGIRNNNPLNLSYLPGQGAIGSDGRFGIFGTPEDGIAAEERQFLVYQDKYQLDTLGKIINRWAPPGENDTNSYAAQVAKMTGLGLNSKINMRDPATAEAVIAAMARVENGRGIDRDAVHRGVGRALGRQSQPAGQYAQQFRDRSVQVQVHNNTGGNANVTISQLSAA